MAIEQMKLLSITGKDADLESLLAQKLINCNIQIEDAKKIYDKGWKLEYYEYDYRVKEHLKKCLNLLKKLGIEVTNENQKYFIEDSIEDIDNKLDEINGIYENSLKEIDDYRKGKSRNNSIYRTNKKT